MMGYQCWNNVTTFLWSTLGLFVFFLIFKYHWNRRWLYYYGSKISGPFGLPLIGSLHVFYKGRKGLMQLLWNVHNEYKQPLMKFWLGSKLVIIPTEPRIIEHLSKMCLEKDELYAEYGDPLFGEGLITLPVPKWREHKKIILRTFNQKILNSYLPLFVKHAKLLVEKLENISGVVEILPYFAKYSIDSTIDCCMGINSCQEESWRKYYSWIRRYDELTVSSILNPLTHVKFLKKYTSAFKEATVICEKTCNFVQSIIERRRKINTENENTFLSRLIKITDEEGGWTNKELMGEVNTFVGAASETTMTTECFVMLMLAIHPEIQQKVYEEICSIFGNSDRDIVSTDLNQLVYLECVIKETLRIFPPFFGTMRSVDEDIVVESQVVPKGSAILVYFPYMQRDPKYWYDPLKFDPGRFLPEGIVKQERYSFLPFNTQPRNCIGHNFAFMTMKSVLATVVRHFELTSCQYQTLEDIELTQGVLLSATRGYGVTLKSRQK